MCSSRVRFALACRPWLCLSPDPAAFVFSWQPLSVVASRDCVRRRRKIPEPNKHFRLVLWFLLYRVHAQLPIDRQIEAIACESCRMPLALFDRFKVDFPHHWNQMLDKRSRRLAHLLKYGEVPGGWTPPNRIDGRSGNYPYTALAERNKSTDSMIYLLRNGNRSRFARSHPS